MWQDDGGVWEGVVEQDLGAEARRIVGCNGPWLAFTGTASSWLAWDKGWPTVGPDSVGDGGQGGQRANCAKGGEGGWLSGVSSCLGARRRGEVGFGIHDDDFLEFAAASAAHGGSHLQAHTQTHDLKRGLETPLTCVRSTARYSTMRREGLTGALPAALVLSRVDDSIWDGDAQV
ncbi:hypothetical protein G7Z17_g5461 [Cylindrodendrum hubeiense]|uniref:Uncharacterized protein n=1 Tax=Cylindrodendrum hubeiense TaxID=595255 RepID=A0A9P5LHT6_9HYPO|nr:hypothetical protein G7Z17_g5461 [Cylindrodendrum hubeiense]